MSVFEKLGIHHSWEKDFRNIMTKSYFPDIAGLATENIVPKAENIFRAFCIPKDRVNTVFVGQDPYPDPKYATGIAFGIPEGLDRPSLKYIRDELECSYEQFDVTMMSWVEQGCLMLNSSLTTLPYQIGKHYSIWKPFLQDVIKAIDKKDVIFVLLGKVAQDFTKSISNAEILHAPHPMADHYSANKVFKGCGIFNQINSKLQQNDKQQINWYRS